MAKKRKKTGNKSSKKGARTEKLFNNLSRNILQFLSGKGYIPLTQKELLEKLDVAEEHIPMCRRVLRRLEVDEQIDIRKKRYVLREQSEGVVTGTIRMHPRGFGFVQPGTETLFTEDIFVPKHLTANAVDGDVVEVMIQQGLHSDRGPEGRVIAIMERARTHVAGIIVWTNKMGEATAYVPILGLDHTVWVEKSEEFHPEVGDRVVLQVLEWGENGEDTHCAFSHHIGHISDPTCDIEAAIEEYDLRDAFPTRVKREVKRISPRIGPKEIAAREDFRDLECITIDPDTARDFDDALSLSRDKKGHYHLGVHIADVSHYVRPGTALDKEAKLRCNSTYFPGRVLPMIPPELSDGLCSLKPKVNRLTVSVLMHFNSRGRLLNYSIARGVIRSRKRFTYKEAYAVLQGKKKSPYKDTLHMMVKLCELFKKVRRERGSVEFALPELVVKVDEEGYPQGMECVEYDITHQLVEEFMLKANEVIATHLTEEGKPLAYRIHQEPTEDNMRTFVQMAKAFGFKLPEKPESDDIQDLFEKAKETPYEQHLAVGFIRSMRLAYYSPDNVGHYGLSLEHYTHFTSPIRRYVDLVVHRTLMDEEGDEDELQAITNQCSDQERISSRAEGGVHLLKKLRYLQILTKDDAYREFDAVVTRVRPVGIAFEVPDLMLDGFLHISRLDADYFVYNERRMTLEGSDSGITYGLGTSFSVRAMEIDLIRLEVQWELLSGYQAEDEVRSSKPSGRRKRRRKGGRKRRS